MNRGERAVKFIENLQHTRGKWAGKKLKLEQWEQDLVHKTFGTLNENGKRTIRTVFAFIPRKNGKSQLAAGIICYCLFADGEHSAEIYSAAASKEQASLVFNEVARMIRADKRLRSLCHIIDSQKTIKYGNSFYKAISADKGNKSGFSASVVIYDELHEAPDGDLWDVLQTSTGAREQPLMMAITTAGADKQHSFCGTIYDYAVKVRDGVIQDETFLPVIYEASPEDDPFAESTWRKANPNYGVSVNAEYLEQMAQQARDLPTQYNAFCRYHLNIWTQSDCRWLNPKKWAECGELTVDLESLKGRECYGGLDLASTSDSCAFCLVFKDDDRYVVLPYFWTPEESAQTRERTDGVPYLTWARQGFMRLTPGNVCDYDRIRADINELRTIYNIKEIALDKWNSVQLMTQLQGDGFDCVPFGQGMYSMAAPTRKMEILVGSTKLVHLNHPVLNWMSANAVAEIDAAANVKINKAKSTEKVDGMVATVMALGRAIAQPEHQPYLGLLRI